MGKRRVRNLLELKVDTILGYDTREDRRKESSELYKINVFDNFESALKENPDGMIISTSPNDHKEYALIASENKIPFFTEVNTMHPKDMQEIVNSLETNHVRASPSSNVMFHPSVVKIEEILKSGQIGKPLIFNFHSGSYLPEWHPWEKLSDYYVFEKETGGGRDQIMWELSWIYQLMGKPKTVFAHTKKMGDFDAKIFDVYNLQIEFEDNIIGNIIVDVIQTPPSRYCEIIGTKGTIKWDYDNKLVKYFTNDSKKWVSYPESDDYKEYTYEKPKPGFARKDVGFVESYVDEMKEFLEVVKGKEPKFTFKEEKILLETMFEAEISSEKGIKRNIS